MTFLQPGVVSNNLEKNDKKKIIKKKFSGPCRFIAPHYEALSNKYQNVKFLKIDVDICKGNFYLNY